ncbi:GrpE protein homolog, mitochondrial, putative [Plasmodium gallinaceum]|uniref:GrpE protein homolog n=1 Tax=Plasmodium gallinaceum TaxID=5849 RepID=A0A1J1GUV8_PLAGA|nr:GrpE protein homolog, mitochondrial, putative [Plasmodium gallinaceum]CRG96295.1 GrpE protein homolog, mitochondrial, putative [Plasmodium gallinaceum]
MKYANFLKRGSIARYSSNLYGMQLFHSRRYYLNFFRNTNKKIGYQSYSTSSMYDEAYSNGENFKKEQKVENKEKENNLNENENVINQKETKNIEKNIEEIDYENYNKIDLIKEIKKVKKDMDEKIIDNKILKEKYLSVLAENENLRNRYIKEIENNKVYCITNFAKSLLDVADNLSLAIQNINEESLKHNEEISNIHKGIQMTETILHNIFNKYGINKYNPINEKFNPSLHEAIFEINDNTKEKGTVATVIQQGYKIKDRILRAAKVGVVKN